jgi:GT2 family glycosyltransferase
MVNVLIPAHNNKHDVLVVLECLSRQTYAELNVVLVDDGSTDGTEEAVRQRFPHVTVLDGNGNLWWAGACALGIEHILPSAREGDYVLLLNNDVVISPEYVSELVSCSVATGRSLVGSTIVDLDNPQDVSAGIWLDEGLRATVNRDTAQIASTICDERVDVLPGRGTLVPIEVYKSVGNFEAKRLPHYGSDYEFTIRARRAGYKLAVSHRAVVHAKFNVTGYHLRQGATYSLGECWKLLFSRRSSANLYYYLTYVWLCSEPSVRIRNVLRNGVGLILETLGHTMIGAPVVAMVRHCARAVKAGARS